MANLLELRQTLIQTIVEGDDEQAATVTATIAEQAQEDFKIFHNILNCLGYHNQLSLLNELMYRTWPQVQDTSTYSKPAVSAFAARATDHLIYEYLQDQPEPNAKDRHLLRKLEHYFPIDSERLESYLLLLSGTVGRPWSMDDFEPLQIHQLNGLLIEFLGYAHRFEHIPFAQTHLAREQLPRYLLDRSAGNLYPKQDMAAMLRQGRRPFPDRNEALAHPLCPDELTLKTFLQRILQTLDPLPYAAAATLELVPVWLRYLEARELLTTEQRTQTLEELEDLGKDLLSFWQDHEDPLLQRNIASWQDGDRRAGA